jgi:putative ABC transport system ATP-binding protein
MTILNVANVTMQHAHTHRPALNEINFTLDKNDMVILLGRNGSGKSTLLKILTKHLYPTFGHIFLKNQSLEIYSHSALHQHIVMLNQQYDHSLFTSLTIHENYLVMIKRNRQSRYHYKNKLIEMLELVNSNLIDKLHLPVHRLSGGEKQALALAFIFLNPPSLLLLDEHTSALDPKTSTHLMNLTNRFIQENEMTCLLTTHDLDIALTYGNRLLILQDGHILKMMSHEEKLQLTKSQLIQSYY